MNVSVPVALVLLFAFCCGAIVANLYYAQPIIELIAPAVGLSMHKASLIVSLTQIGYALGLLFLVPPARPSPARSTKALAGRVQH